MIISVEEFKEMGFSSSDDELTADCIKRAEYVLNSLSGGRAILVSHTSGACAEYVKQACAFQANAILREEKAYREQSAEPEKSIEKATIGDFSYTYSSSGADKRDSTDIQALDTNLTVIRLLRAAGCLYTGTEVSE